MKEKINELIPKAIHAIVKAKIADENGEVEKEFKGYISSIGASIIQAGLLPTLAFFQNSSGKNADSSKVLNAVLILLKDDLHHGEKLISFVINKCNTSTSATNSITVSNLDKDKLYLIQEDIMDAIVALKLALRIYKIKGDE